MSLLFFDGFQDPVLMSKPEWGGSHTTAATGRDGVASGAAQTTSGVTAAQTCTFPSTAATGIIGMAGKVSAISSSATWIAVMGAGGSQQLTVTVNTSGLIEIRKGSKSGTLLATSSGHTPLTTNTWYHLQAKTVLHLTAGSCDVRLNGVLVASVSGVSTATVTENVGGYAYGAPGTGGITMNVDDLWFCDTVDATATQGRANNDFLGDLRVVSLFPSADGDTTQFTPSTGTNHAALVDENPATTTDYNQDSITGDRDMYQLDDLSASALTVYGLRLSLYTLKTDTGARTVKPLLKESGGTVTTDTAQGLGTSVAGVHGTLRVVKPSTGGVWSVSDVNGLQAGVEVA